MWILVKLRIAEELQITSSFFGASDAIKTRSVYKLKEHDR
jgi:hypothetical protein